MAQPDTPFPRHWLYYIALKVVVIAVAVAVALKFLGYWIRTAYATCGSRTPLSLRHHAARRRADQRRRLLARRTSSRSPRMLDELGIDYIEGGYPGANPTDTRALRAPSASLRATFTAFGMTSGPGRSTANDPGLRRCSTPRADAICFVAKTWDYHVEVALGTTLEENLAGIRDSVRAAVADGREVLLDCEHFFDGYKANPDYALACAKTAYEAGARWVVLCDTNGGTLPARDRGDRRRGGEADPRRPSSASMCITTPTGGGQFARRGARRRAPDPGHAERARRALRQRQSHLDHPDPDAEVGLCRALRDRRRRREARRRLPMSRARSTRCSTARRTGMRPMSASAPSPPRPASMSPPC